MTIGRLSGLLVAAIMLAGLGYGASYWYPIPVASPTPPDRTDQDTHSETRSHVEAQGRLEPAGGTLAVGALPGEQLVALPVRTGQRVQAGEELARLNSAEMREAEYQLAEEKLQAAEAQLQSELALGQLRIAAAQLSQKQIEARRRELPPDELLEVAQQRLDLARERLEKLEQLRSDPATHEAIAQSELEQQRLLIQQIEAELKQNHEKREAASETQQLALDAAQLESRMAELTQEGLTAASPVPSLQRAVELARLARDATKVLAPIDGTILELYVHEGERVANTPILQMADLTRMVCVAEVHEANLKDLQVVDQAGKLVPARDYPVTIYSSALQRELHGRIVEVGRLIGAPALRDPNPLARSDRRTAKTIIQLDEPSTQIAQRFVHLQVDVTIELRPERAEN